MKLLLFADDIHGHIYGRSLSNPTGEAQKDLCLKPQNPKIGELHSLCIINTFLMLFSVFLLLEPFGWRIVFG